MLFISKRITFRKEYISLFGNVNELVDLTAIHLAPSILLVNT